MVREEQTPWRPVLEGDLARQAEQVLLDIDRALEPLVSHPRSEPDPSLARGDTGLCVLQAVLERAYPGRGHGERAVALLERAFEGVGASSVGPGLYPGYSGVAWAAEYLRGRVLSEEEDPTADVDSALEELLASGPFQGEYELVHGLVGLGVYALERLPSLSGRRLLEGVVAQLAARAVAVPGGRVLLTERRSAPGMRFVDLGMAHGLVGAVALLAGAWHQGVAAARPLLDDFVAWMLAHRHPRDAETAFPNWRSAHSEHPVVPSQTGWCYGDLSTAVALLAAARATHNPAWEQQALDVARGTLRRGMKLRGVLGAGLCHGAAGLGHLYLRLFNATAEPPFADAARRWFDRALAQREPGTGLAGFRTPETREGPGLDDPGLLTGVTGIALALVSAIHPLAPSWDRAMLLQLPCRQAASTPLSRDGHAVESD